MVGPPRWLSFAIALAFSAALSIAPGALAVCSTTVTGTLYVPTGVSNPPPFATPTVNHGVNAWFVFTIYPGELYELAAVSAISLGCVLSNCLRFADFNVAWYEYDTPFDSQIVDDDAAGNQNGNIPINADYALVYMAQGPDLLGSDGSAGAKFTLGMDC